MTKKIFENYFKQNLTENPATGYTGRTPGPEEADEFRYKYQGPTSKPTSVIAIHKKTQQMSRPVKIDYAEYKNRGHSNFMALAMMFAKGQAALSLAAAVQANTPKAVVDKQPQGRGAPRGPNTPPSSARVMKETLEETIKSEIAEVVYNLPEFKLAKQVLSKSEINEQAQMLQDVILAKVLEAVKTMVSAEVKKAVSDNTKNLTKAIADTDLETGVA